MDARAVAASACIGDIYEAASDQTAWPNAMEALRDVFHGSAACLVRVGPGRRPDDVALNTDPAFQDSYMSEFSHEPEAAETDVAVISAGLVCHDLTFVGPEKPEGGGFWNEWMAPRDMHRLTSKLLVSGQSSWFFDVQRARDQSPFDAADVALFKFISPHLRRAIKLRRQNRMASLLSSALSHLPFGVLLVDSSQRILCLNDAAEGILSEPHRTLFRKGGELIASDRAKNAILQKLIGEACVMRGGLMPGAVRDLLISPKPDAKPSLKSSLKPSLKSGHGSSATLAISVGPSAGNDVDAISLEPCAFVIIRKLLAELPPNFTEEIRRVFDLTPKEASLAASLAAGLSLKDVARETGVQCSTVRTHLDRIFRKTGTRRQSQLVAVLKNVQPLSRRP